MAARKNQINSTIYSDDVKLTENAVFIYISADAAYAALPNNY